MQKDKKIYIYIKIIIKKLIYTPIQAISFLVFLNMGQQSVEQLAC